MTNNLPVRLDQAEIEAAKQAGYLVPTRKKDGFFGGMFSFFPTFFGRPTFWPMSGQARGPVNVVESVSGQTVTPATALTLSVVWACTWLVARTIATIPLDLKRQLASGKLVNAIDLDLYDVLRWEPNERMTASDFWMCMLCSLQLWGNAYARKLYRSNGSILGLDPLRPEWMTVYLVNGRVRYRYDDPLNPRDFAADDIWHLKDRSIDGLVGASVIEFGRNSFGLAQSGEAAASKTFKNGMQASGYLLHEKFLTVPQREQIHSSIAEFSAGGTKTGGTMVLEGAFKDYKQLSLKPLDAELLSSREFSVADVCFVPGTQILTPVGPRDIENIQIGDRVLTHKGRWRKVTNVMRREYVGPVVTLQAKGLPAVTSTAEHRFFAQATKPNLSHSAVIESDPQWVSADQLIPIRRYADGQRSNGRFHNLIIPRIQPSVGVLDMAVYASETGVITEETVKFSRNYKAVAVPRYIEADESIGWLCGAYACDGSSSDHQSVFYFGTHETESIRKAIEIIQTRFGVKASARPRGTATAVECANTLLARMFREFGTTAHLKKLPDWCMAQSKEFNRGLIEALIVGDGYRYKLRAGLRTTSDALAWQTRLILWADGRNSSMRTEAAKQYVIHGRTGPSRPMHTVEWRSVQQRRGTMGSSEEGVYFGLDRADRGMYGGTVFNLEVEEDESYTTVGGVAHNCRWFGVNPAMVGHSSDVTQYGTGLESIFGAFTRQTVRPITNLIVQGVRKDLIPEADKRTLIAVFDLDDLMAGDSQAMANLLSSLTQNGIMTRNEGREKMGLSPEAGGDALTVQSNLIPLDRLGDSTTSTPATDLAKSLTNFIRAAAAQESKP